MNIFEQALSNISGGQILDIATSRGGFVGRLKEHLKSYTSIIGIDVDAQILEMARDNFDEENIQFMLMDAGQLEFEIGRFDTVTASASLHHLPNIAQALAEINRVLKPGGNFIFIEMHRDAQTEAQRTLVQMHHWAADVDTARGVFHNKTFTRQELIEFIESMGLHNVIMHDFWETDSGPMDEEAISHCEEVIGKVLQRADGFPEYKLLKARSKELRKRLHNDGVHWEPVLFILGQKPFTNKTIL
ncbi:MAG: class I SAM-dependent methyltransferase [Chloroflexi bacterium]|nr:class I SAM-dependent methyltransferase [Chloroflexota bacterium]